ncbi:MAG: aminoacyltransferase [Clostridiaceae bacterium]|nr:aminoacyltransferase [Clostridiaceae bacterium]
MYTFVDDVAEIEFNAFAGNYKNTHLLQSYQWAQVKNTYKPLYVGVKQDDKLIATALILIRSLPLGLKFAYIPRGPLIDFTNQELLKFFNNNLKKVAKANGCFMIRIDPGIAYKVYKVEAKDDAEVTEYGQNVIDILKNNGYIHRGLPLKMHDSFQPRFVAIGSLNDSTLNNYQNRLKRALRRIQKRGTKIESGTYQFLDEMASMIKLTESRKNVNLRNREYFNQLLDAYPETAKIYLAYLTPKKNIEIFTNEINSLATEIEAIKEKSPKKVHRLTDQINSLKSLVEELEDVKDEEKIVIGSLLKIDFGNTVNLLYAGNDVKFTKFYPQEFIYDYIIKESLKKGYKYVDMGGVEGSLDDGLTYFKSQFSPDIVEYIGEFDMPLSFKYKLFNFAWKMRQKLRNR